MYRLNAIFFTTQQRNVAAGGVRNVAAGGVAQFLRGEPLTLY